MHCSFCTLKQTDEAMTMHALVSDAGRIVRKTPMPLHCNARRGVDESEDAIASLAFVTSSRGRLQIQTHNFRPSTTGDISLRRLLFRE